MIYYLLQPFSRSVFFFRCMYIISLCNTKLAGTVTSRECEYSE